MTITLTTPKGLKPVQHILDFDSALDDERSILFSICETLSDIKGVHFGVSVGAERWPVDAEIDLVVCLEQIPRAVEALQDRRTFELDFYEQGIERRISFNALDAGTYEISAVPGSGIEVVPAKEVDNCIASFIQAFDELARSVCPRLYAHPLLIDWRQAVSAFAALPGESA